MPKRLHLQDHVDRATHSLSLALIEVKKPGFKGLSVVEISMLNELQQQTTQLRNAYIRHLFHNGVATGKEIAQMFNLTAARISQICHEGPL